jgi:hypothetical protein
LIYPAVLLQAPLHFGHAACRTDRLALHPGEAAAALDEWSSGAMPGLMAGTKRFGSLFRELENSFVEA